MRLTRARGVIKQVVAGESRIRQLFKREHTDFLKDLGQIAISKAFKGKAPDFDRLTIFGPIMAHHWEFHYPGSPKKIIAELWIRWDEDRLMEFSTRWPAAYAAFAKSGFKGLLEDVGVQRDLEAKSKTRWALSNPPSPAAGAAMRPTDATDASGMRR